MSKVVIHGVSIAKKTFSEVMEEIEEHLLNHQNLKTIYTPNTEIVMDCKDNTMLKQIINEGHWVTPDGIGLIYGSKMRKFPLPERVTGYDISMELLKFAHREHLKLYFLGGKPGQAQKAAEKVKAQYPNIEETAYHHGYFDGIPKDNPGAKEELKIVESINKFQPDIIFVGLGSPKQELFIDRYKEQIEGKIIIGNGGVIDILSGSTKRAPDIFIKLGLEWFYRLIKEPKRIKRQMAIPKFLFTVITDKNSVKEEE